MRPKFFIVGAPRCGTTAMYNYLREHPGIFIPEIKEIHFFSTDIPWRRGAIRDKIKTEGDYLKIFNEAREGQVAGAANVWDLYSEVAPKKIKEFNPEAKIIIMLRNPVKMVHSLHSVLVWGGREDIEDFSEAINAIKDRKEGRRIPGNIPEDWEGELFYTDFGKYTQHVQKYFDTFGKENVHIIIFDDFKKDIAGVYQKTVEFIGADTGFKPDFKVINANKKPYSKKLQHLLNTPPPAVKQLARLVPVKLLSRTAEFLRNLNSSPEKREPMDKKTRQMLEKYFEEDISGLSQLLERDLVNSWLKR